MPWYFFVIISVFFGAISTVLIRNIVSKEKSDPISFAIFFQIIAGLVVGFFALYKGINIIGFNAIIPNLLLMVLLYAFSNFFKFKALKQTDASKYVVIFQAHMIIPVIFAIVILGESFSIWQGIGALLILAGATIVTDGKINFKREKGEVYSVITTILFGLAIANDFFILKTVDPYTFTVVSLLAPAILLSAIYPTSFKNTKYILKSKDVLKQIIAGALFGLMVLTAYIAYKVGNNAAIISPLSQTSTILTIILGVIFLGERENLPKKLLGGILSILGVIIVTLL